MLPHVRNLVFTTAFQTLLFSALMLATACGATNTEKPADTSALTAELPAVGEYHADNDIAMTVRSLADAIRVGEPLDSTEYDFEGVLTDGQGAPLYTDVQGGPGIWVIDVLDQKNVTIKNLYLGDLLPGDLESYLLQSLRLTDENRMTFTAHDAVNDEETNISVYDFNGGYLRFEIRSGIAPNGLEGPLLTIIMSADLPSGAETQTAA